MNDDVKLPPCSDKLEFDTEKEAVAEARAIKWRRGNILRPYQCRYCGLWHLSSGLGD